MREILFRGKRLDNGEWVYGYYVKAKENFDGNEDYRAWIIVRAYTIGGYFNVTMRYAVAPATVGQYTGVVDKNGAKIFEGDVVKAHDALIWRDESCDFCGVVGFDCASFMIADDCFTHYRWMDYNLEIIGNIYDQDKTPQQTNLADKEANHETN